jgi:hypothetical protein
LRSNLSLFLWKDSSEFSAASHRARLLVALSPNFEVFSAESLRARLKLKNIQKWTLYVHLPNTFEIGAVAVELTSEDLNDIDSALSKVKIQGARYPEELEKEDWPMSKRQQQHSGAEVAKLVIDTLGK